MKKFFFSLVITVILLTLMLISVNAEVISSEGRLAFTDVKQGAWYHDAVVYSYLNNYIYGVSDARMAPGSALTREAAVTILARISGDDLSAYGTQNVFTDVKAGQWYTKEINWAYANGYISGITEARFGTGQSMTREQFARVLCLYISHRYGETEVTTDLKGFSDSHKVSDWALEAMGFCVQEGIIVGTYAHTLSPQATLTRAQMAVLTKSFTLRYAYGDCEHAYTVPTCTEPSYCEYCHVKIALPKGHICDTLTCVQGGYCKSCKKYIAADKALHSFGAATCTQPSRCIYCNTAKGNALGHSYKDATCTLPMTCLRCSATKGKALGHTDYNGLCARCKTYNYRTKIINAPYIDQRENWPNGCEAVSTVMALRYYGVDITVDHFITGYMPYDDAPDPGGYGPDPDKVYCGDPFSSEGWGCYSPVIVNTLKSLLVPQYWTIEHSYSLSVKELCSKYIDRDIPVIMWATVNMRESSSYAYWTTPEGKKIAYNRNLHCLLLVGYDNDNYYFNDPLKPGNSTKYVAYPKAKVEAAYKLLGNQSVAFYPN